MSAFPASLLNPKLIKVPLIDSIQKKENDSNHSCHHCKMHRRADNLLFCKSSLHANSRFDVIEDSGRNYRACRKKFCHNCLLKFYGELFCFPHGITEDPQIFDVHSLPKTSVKVAPTSPGSNGRRGSVSAEIVSALVSLKDRDPTHESKEKHKDFFRMIINNITSSTAPCSIDDIVDTDDVAVLKEVRDLVSYKLDVLDFVDVLYWICPACRDLCKCIACQRSKLLHAQSAAANEKKTTTLAKRESSSSPTFQTPNNKESKFKLRKISPVGFVYGVSGGAYRNTALLKAFSCMKSWPSIPVPRRIFPQVLSKEICSGYSINHANIAIPTARRLKIKIE